MVATLAAHIGKAALSIPTLFALCRVNPAEIDYDLARGAPAGANSFEVESI
jgi:hypothetical protein